MKHISRLYLALAAMICSPTQLALPGIDTFAIKNFLAQKSEETAAQATTYADLVKLVAKSDRLHIIPRLRALKQELRELCAQRALQPGSTEIETKIKELEREANILTHDLMSSLSGSIVDRLQNYFSKIPLDAQVACDKQSALGDLFLR